MGQDTEDAVQETFLQALNGLPSFRGESHPNRWIYRIAVNAGLKGKRGLDSAYLDSPDEVAAPRTEISSSSLKLYVVLLG